MILNAVWLPTFMMNNTFGFIVSLIIIALMLVTQWYILMKVHRAKLDVMQFICLRIAFTVYSGWVTAATIVAVTFMLSAFGMN
jgi:hypothetical protein